MSNKSITHSTALEGYAESERAITKSTTIIGVATFCSRLLGFCRDVVIAKLFGIYIYAQAFVIAFRIPNLFRDLCAEGATNAAFIPVFSEYKLKYSKEEFWELANVILNLLLIVLMVLTILGIIFSGLIVRLIAPGFVVSPEKLATTIKLSRIIFPYILLISLAAYSTAILNTLGCFSVSAFAPCLLNISIIIFALLFGEGIKGLASGVLVGGILQLAVQIPLLYKKGFRLKRPRSFSHPAAKTIGILLLPRILSSSVYQLNNFVDSIFGSLVSIVGEGGVAVLYFSYRLIQFPLGIFSNALSQAILPTFSVQALDDNRENLKQTLSFGLQATFLVMVPASVGFMVLSKPIISTLFAGGNFNIYAVEKTANALFFYSIGLCAYAGSKILQSCFFALKDTVTPTKIACLAVIINMSLNFILMFPLKIGGVALATSISAINTFLVLFVILKKRLGDFKVERIIVSFLRILAASFCMGLVCYIVSAGTSVLNKYLHLALTLLSGILSYIVFCFILRVPQMQELWQRLTHQSQR